MIMASNIFKWGLILFNTKTNDIEYGFDRNLSFNSLINKYTYLYNNYKEAEEIYKILKEKYDDDSLLLPEHVRNNKNIYKIKIARLESVIIYDLEKEE
jgi:hypothetical protein